VSELRAELAVIVEQLVHTAQANGTGRDITLDALGEAIGIRAVSFPEVDAMIANLEARGFNLVTPDNLRGEQLLRSVLGSLRTLSPRLGRRPNHAEIAEHAGLSVEEVRYALLFSQIIQR
jgi:hypothetical protein